MKRLATNPELLKDEDLVSLLALDMAHADNGASLVAYIWIQKHYLGCHHKEIEAGIHILEGLMMVAKGAQGELPMLGEIICATQKHQQELKDECPKSIRRLLEHQRLNDVGEGTAHGLAASSASDIKRAPSPKEIDSCLPDWVARPEWRPGRGSVLLIAPCSIGVPCDICITEQILGKEPDRKIRRAVPGAILDDAESLPAEFLLLHSPYFDSKKTSLDTADVAHRTQVHAGWKRHASPSVDKHDFVDQCDYEGGGRNEYVATPVIMRSVGGQVVLTLEAKHPVAVVIVGTGQKAAVLGAFQATQA